MELRNHREEIERVVASALEALTRHGYSDTSKFAVRLAIEEALSNAFRHGHQGLAGDTPVLFSYRVGPRDVEISVEDKGPGFNPRDVPDPTADDRIELPSGRGLMLMRAYMAKVAYNERGNRVTMVYQKPLLRK